MTGELREINLQELANNMLGTLLLRSVDLDGCDIGEGLMMRVNSFKETVHYIPALWREYLGLLILTEPNLVLNISDGNHKHSC